MPNDPVQSVSSGEMVTTMTLPAIFVNKLYVSMAGPIAKITFAEHSVEAGVHARASVAMTINDAVALRDLLGGMLQNASVVEANPSAGSPPPSNQKPN